MLKKLIFIFLLLIASQTFSAQQTKPKVNKGIVNGSAVNLPKPSYPAAAKAVKASGEVKVQVIIDEAGTVVSAKAISGHPLLTQVSEQAALQSKFKPTTLEGKPVQVSGVILYNFVPDASENADSVGEEFLGVGMFFAMLERADDNMLRQMGIENDITEMLSTLAETIPSQMSGEKPLLDKLAASKGAERQKTAGELSKSLEKYLKGSELEGYRTGFLFGNVLAETASSALVLLTDPNAKIETTKLKSELILFREKLTATKSFFNPETAADLQEIADYADAQDLGNSDSLRRLFLSITKMLDKISTDETEEEPNTPAMNKEAE